MYISSVFTFIRIDEDTNKQNLLYQHKGLACHSVIIISHYISQFSTQCWALESDFIVSLIVKTNSIFFSVQNLDASNCLPLSHGAIPDLYDLIAFNSQTSSLIHSITAMLSPQSSALLWSLGHVAHITLAWHNFSFAKTPIPLVFMFTMYCFPLGHPPNLRGAWW